MNCEKQEMEVDSLSCDDFSINDDEGAHRLHFEPGLQSSDSPGSLRGETEADNKTEESASKVQQTNFESLHASGDVRIGVADEQIEHCNHPHSSTEDDPSSSPAESSLRLVKRECEECLRIRALLNKLLSQTVSETKIIGPDGGSIELDGCELSCGPGDDKLIKVTTVESSGLPSPPPYTAVSLAFKFQPSKMDNSVTPKSSSSLCPNRSDKLDKTKLSETGDDGLEEVGHTTSCGGNMIELEESQPRWYVLVVSEEEEKKGKYHLFNDIWMHMQSGLMVALFCKDIISLTKAKEVFQNDYTRILAMPEELIVSIGQKVKLHLEYDGQPELKIETIDGSISQLDITHKKMKENYFTIFFQHSPQLGTVPLDETVDGRYAAAVYDENDTKVYSVTRVIDFPLDVMSTLRRQSKT